MAVAPWRTWTALGLVYVVWGSTYLAIRYAVVGLPPLLTAATRFATAAVLIALYVLVRRGPAAFRASRRAWTGGAGIGLLLLLGGNGGVVLAEDRGLPSGLAALLVAAVPLYVVLLRLAAHDRPSARTLLGVTIGFAGLGLLLLPGARPQGVPVLAAATVLASSALWSVGSFAVPRLTLPADPLVATVAEMLGGAAGLAVAGLLRGESPRVHDVPASAFVAVGYLIVFGSVVAFTAYSWLLGTAPVSKVATYAYVNPVVAVVLGAVVAGEDLSAVSVLGGLVTVVAVAVVVSETAPPVRVEVLEPAQAPAERQGRLRRSAT